MASTLTHIAAVVAGLAICATAFTVRPNRGYLGGAVIAIALGIAAAFLITAARSFAP